MKCPMTESRQRMAEGSPRYALGRRCTEYLLEDAVMSRVDELLGRVDSAAELEVVKYAA
jgi:hypothetical protein